MSSTLKSLQRRNVILTAVAVILALVLILRPAPTTSASKEALAFAFPGFTAEEARRIELIEPAHGETPEAKVVLQKAESGKWQLESHYRYPLQAGADRLLDAIASARVKAVVTEREETFSNYEAAHGWTDVAVVDSRGRTLLSFGLGRYQYPDSFLRLDVDGGERIVKATNLVPNMAKADATAWIDTRIWPNLSSANMIRIDVEQPVEARTITLVKRGETAADLETAAPEKDPEGKKVYWMTSPVEGDAKKLAVEDLAREFTGMLIEDIVAGSTTAEEDEKMGFTKPQAVATLFHKEGDKVSKYTLTIGNKIEGGDAWYARRGDGPWVFTVSASTGVNRMRQAPQAFLEPPPAPEPDGTEPKDGDAVGDPDGVAPGDPPKVPAGDGSKDAPKDPPADPPKDPPADPPKDPPADPPKDPPSD